MSIPIALQVLELVAAVGCAFLALLALNDLCAGRRITTNIAVIMFFAYYGLPVFLDYYAGFVDYNIHPGYAPARYDQNTTVLYALSIVAIPAIVLFIARVRTSRQPFDKEILPTGHFLLQPFWRKVIYGAAWLPVLVAILSPARLAYLSFGSVYSRYAPGVGAIQDSPTALLFHAVISFATIFSVLFVSFLIATSPRSISMIRFGVLVLPAVVGIWLNGKRFIVAYLAVLLFSAIWVRGRLRGLQIAIAGAALLILLFGFSAWYQNTERGADQWEQARQHEMSRVDYGRDHNLRLALYAETRPNMDILEYRGQSAISYATIFVPRAIWPEKPRTYAMHLTDAALMEVDPNRGWGVTTSMVDESVANFGYPGILIGALLLALIGSVGDRTRSLSLTLTSTFVITMLLSVHLAAFYPLFGFWIVLAATTWVRPRFFWRKQTRDLPAVVRGAGG